MRSSVFKGFFLVFFCVGLGWQVAHLSIDQHVEIKSAMIQFGNEWRNPAAIRRTNDFSLLSGVAFHRASHRRLFEDVRVVSHGEKRGVELGHFVVKGSSGEKQFACEYYDRVQLKFSAQNMAVNGEIPEMLVEGFCGISADINRMLPLWLPVDELKAMGARELSGFYFETEKVFVTIKNLGSQWPQGWELRGVRLFHQVKVGREIAVDSSKIFLERSLREKPVIIRW